MGLESGRSAGHYALKASENAAHLSKVARRVVGARPRVLLIPLAVCALLMGLGLWGVNAGKHRAQDIAAGSKDPCAVDAWFGPLVALAVVAPLVVAGLLFTLLFTRARHAMLLPSLVPGGCLSKLKEVELLDVGPQAPPLRGPGGTSPADRMLTLLGDLLDGKMPGTQDVLLLRAAVLQSYDTFAYQSFEERMATSQLDQEVTLSLMHQLGGTFRAHDALNSAAAVGPFAAAAGRACSVGMAFPSASTQAMQAMLAEHLAGEGGSICTGARASPNPAGDRGNTPRRVSQAQAMVNTLPSLDMDGHMFDTMEGALLAILGVEPAPAVPGHNQRVSIGELRGEGRSTEGGVPTLDAAQDKDTSMHGGRRMSIISQLTAALASISKESPSLRDSPRDGHTPPHHHAHHTPSHLRGSPVSGKHSTTLSCASSLVRDMACVEPAMPCPQISAPSTGLATVSIVQQQQQHLLLLQQQLAAAANGRRGSTGNAPPARPPLRSGSEPRGANNAAAAHAALLTQHSANSVLGASATACAAGSKAADGAGMAPEVGKMRPASSLEQLVGFFTSEARNNRSPAAVALAVAAAATAPAGALAGPSTAGTSSALLLGTLGGGACSAGQVGLQAHQAAQAGHLLDQEDAASQSTASNLQNQHQRTNTRDLDKQQSIPSRMFSTLSSQRLTAGGNMSSGAGARRASTTSAELNAQGMSSTSTSSPSNIVGETGGAGAIGAIPISGAPAVPYVKTCNSFGPNASAGDLSQAHATEPGAGSFMASNLLSRSGRFHEVVGTLAMDFQRSPSNKGHTTASPLRGEGGNHSSSMRSHGKSVSFLPAQLFSNSPPGTPMRNSVTLSQAPCIPGPMSIPTSQNTPARSSVTSLTTPSPSPAQGTTQPSAPLSTAPTKHEAHVKTGGRANAVSFLVGKLKLRGVSDNGKPTSAESLSGAPAFQVHAEPSPPILEQVERVLANAAASWAFDTFELAAITRGRPLSTLTYYLMVQSGVVASANLHPVKLARFLRAVEDGYRPNPYHSKTHAADVVQTMHMIVMHGGMAPLYTDQTTLLACYMAACVHDYEHVGLTNDFLVKSGDQLARVYNDRSPLENHHLSAAFALLRRPDFNFLQNLPLPEFTRLRKTAIELVLGTDMSLHFSILNHFSVVQRLGPSRKSAAEILAAFHASEEASALPALTSPNAASPAPLAAAIGQPGGALTGPSAAAAGALPGGAPAGGRGGLHDSGRLGGASPTTSQIRPPHDQGPLAMPMISPGAAAAPAAIPGAATATPAAVVTANNLAAAPAAASTARPGSTPLVSASLTLLALSHTEATGQISFLGGCSTPGSNDSPTNHSVALASGALVATGPLAPACLHTDISRQSSEGLVADVPLLTAAAAAASATGKRQLAERLAAAKAAAGSPADKDSTKLSGPRSAVSASHATVLQPPGAETVNGSAGDGSHKHMSVSGGIEPLKIPSRPVSMPTPFSHPHQPHAGVSLGGRLMPRSNMGALLSKASAAAAAAATATATASPLEHAQPGAGEGRGEGGGAAGALATPGHKAPRKRSSFTSLIVGALSGSREQIASPTGIPNGIAANPAPGGHGSPPTSGNIRPTSGPLPTANGTQAAEAQAPVLPRAPLDDSERILALQVALKAADLGHLCENLDVHCRWVECLEEEFFRQGDREKALGLPVSPLFDRDKPGVTKSQVGFCEVIALPLFHDLASAFPGTRPMLQGLVMNYQYWRERAQQQQQQ